MLRGLATGSLVLPTLALAIGSTGLSGQKSVGGVLQVICNAIGWAFTILLVATVIIVLYAAFKYLTAGGDPEKVKGASHLLIYAAVAIVVAFFAKAFPYIVGGILGGNFQGC